MFIQRKKKYDEEPVCYCKYCLSLKIIEEDGIVSCDACGSANVDMTDIETWEKLYEEKYRRPHILR